MATNSYRVEISPKSILITFAILLGAYFLYLISEIILFVFIAILLSAALNPLVAKLQQFKLGRGISIAVIYLILLAIIAVGIAIIVPPLVAQIITLIGQIPIPPDLAANLKNINLSLQDLQVIANQLTSVPKLLNVVTSAFSGVVVFVSLLVMTFYLLLERTRLPEYLMVIYKDQTKAKQAVAFIQQVETQIGGWVRAEATLMLIVGLLTFIGLVALRINFALSLAIIAGLLEILPSLGPTLSAIPAIAVAYFTVSPVMALAVGVLYVLVQQIENNLIVPMVMRQTVGLSPVVTMVLLLIGFTLNGVTGAALAIPIFLVAKVLVVEIYKFRHELK